MMLAKYLDKEPTFLEILISLSFKITIKSTSLVEPAKLIPS